MILTVRRQQLVLPTMEKYSVPAGNGCIGSKIEMGKDVWTTLRDRSVDSCDEY